MFENLFKKVSILMLVLFIPFNLIAAPVLVDSDWLEKRLGDKDLVIVDMSATNMQFQRFHIPGAVSLPYQALVVKHKGGISMRAGDGRLIGVLGMLGIDAEKHVVIYDDMGGLEAGRLFWELEKIGHKEVSVLNGGLVKWILEGRKVESTSVEPVRTVYKVGTSGRDNEIDIAGVKQVIDNKSAVLLDVRSDREYIGDPRKPRSGHIPGARLWSWNGSVNFKQGFQLRSSNDLLAELKSLDIESGKPVITYCRSGHRAAQSYLVLRHLGFDQVQVYDGSMAEWERRTDLPIKKGK